MKLQTIWGDNMKHILTITILIFTASSSYASCQSSKAEAQLFSMLKVEGKLSDWVGVGRRSSFRRDRAIPIYVSQARTLDRSVIQFRKQTLTLNGAQVCLDPSKAGRILLQHSNYDGTLSVQRRGSSLEDSVIRLRKMGSLLETYIKPVDVIE